MNIPTNSLVLTIVTWWEDDPSQRSTFNTIAHGYTSIENMRTTLKERWPGKNPTDITNGIRLEQAHNGTVRVQEFTLK